MFCRYCGCEIADDANFCAKCGRTFVDPIVKEVPKKNNNLGVAALIFSIPPFVGFCGLGGIVSFILAILGLKFAKKNQGEGHKISFAALLISCFWLALWIFMIVFVSIMVVISS